MLGNAKVQASSNRRPWPLLSTPQQWPAGGDACDAPEQQQRLTYPLPLAPLHNAAMASHRPLDWASTSNLTLPPCLWSLLITPQQRPGGGDAYDVPEQQQRVTPPLAPEPSYPCSNGQEAVTPVTRLSSSKNNFERNTVDHFDLTLPNVGVMKRIRIGHDNSGLGADWHLNMVRMHMRLGGASMCMTHLSSHEMGDGGTAVTLR